MTAEQEEQSRGPRHVPALDGLRGVAFLMVFAFHASRSSAAAPFSLGAKSLLEGLAGYGWLGVDLFFVLSGYLITGILLKERGSDHYYRNFYARRALRIFPVYYLAVAIVFVAQPGFYLAPGAGHPEYPWTVQIWFWLNLSNLLTAFRPLVVLPLTHFWSLAIEEQFYLVWPGVVRRLSRRVLLWLAGGLLVAGEVARNLPLVIRLTNEYPNFTYRMTPLHCDGLLCGAVLALLVQSPELVSAARLRTGLVVLGGGVALLVGALAYGLELAGWITVLLRWSFLLAGLFFASVVGLVLLSGPGFWLSRVFSVRWLRWVGGLSYALYVFHLAALHVGGLLAGRLGSGSVVLTAVLGFGVCLGLAMISGAFIERPALRLKRYFRAG